VRTVAESIAVLTRSLEAGNQMPNLG